MGRSKNGPIKVFLSETYFEWKIVKMVDLLSEFDLKYVVRKTTKGSVVSNFCA